MNKRMKELKDQALQECLDISDSLTESETITLREFHNAVEDRFVELIVRRVISVYNDNETFKTSTYDDNRVLEYFGIEK